jgi:multisubunit Na+/H+ antiporter MnhG subunit
MLINPAASTAIARAAYKMRLPMWSGSVRDAPRRARRKRGRAR